MFEWLKRSQQSGEPSEEQKWSAELRHVEFHLEMMGYNLLPTGAAVSLAELVSGYNAVETASHIAHTTLARDVSEAGSDITILAALHAHGRLLLDVLKEYKDDGRMHPTQRQNDSLAVYRLVTIDDQQQKWIRDILADPIAGKERIAVSRLDYSNLIS